MPHLYDKAPPAFARDPWAWDYTRDRLESNTGIPYDQWQGKHFAGAAAMYKNVVKKYASNMQAGNTTMPKECVDCGLTCPHYVDDYICRDCRDLIENASTYAEAAKTISNPGALDTIREQLYEALGHAKKDAKKASVTPIVSTSPPAFREQLAEMVEHARAANKVSRNYKAMSVDKLQRTITELELGMGEAISKVKVGETIEDHLEAAYRAAQEKGL